MVLSEKNKKIVNLFEHFHQLFNAKNVLNINTVENPYPTINYDQKKDFNKPNFSTLLDEIKFEQTIIKTRFIPQEIHKIVNSNIKYDMLIAQFPFNVKNSSIEAFYNSEERFKNFNTNFENIALFDTMKLLKKDGFCFFFSQSSILNNQKKFIKLIENEGFFLNGIINVKNIYIFTNIDIYLCIFSRKQRKNLFAGELSEFNSKALINNFYSFIKNNYTSLSSSDIFSGVLTTLDECYNLETLKHQLELRSVLKHYKDFKKYNLNNIAKITAVKTGGTHIHDKNSIYLPKIGLGRVYNDLEQTKIKHQNLFKITLNPKIVKSEYAAWFFSSEIGQKLRKSIMTGSTIKNITKSFLTSIEIPVPKVEKQKMIAEASKKITVINEKLLNISQDFTVNPLNINNTLEKLNTLIDQFGALSGHDKVKILLKNGEDSKVEYKQTLSLNVFTKMKDKAIETSSIKTVAAFLNTNGGDLLIGVNDNSEIIGLNSEVKKIYKDNYDKFKLHFKDIFETRIGKRFLPFINSELIDMDGLFVFKVNCQSLKDRHSDGCYVDNKDFYVRTDPATTKLQGPDVTKYIRNHFENNN